ncbi:MAG TPA: GAF domain-containing protein [Baekduia sp.]|uniref:GAF domain-containing protein n=1 Tax=Baekduia sp. TaxID=2600305 RepID=UPI002BC81EDE|nr:GAF domain-containing protein [Baekduia sp.]HMJ36953.1 GAF domain-containing protein [Baekduia sp.]
MSELRSLAERYLRAFNERDFAAWDELLHDEVAIMVDGRTLRGPAEARAYAEHVVRSFPGVVVAPQRVVSASGDTIVMEHRLVNPREEARRSPPGRPASDDWRLTGLTCEIYRFRDGRLIELHSYYAPAEDDRTDVVQVPSRSEATHIAEEQAALRRVATLVARGVSQTELIAAVNEEVGRLVGADVTAMTRFEADDMTTLVAAWSTGEEVGSLPMGAQRPSDPAIRELRRTGRPIRFGLARLRPTGTFLGEARRLGVTETLVVPIEVQGQVWGSVWAATTRPEPFPPDTEARITGFTELVATAIANAQARAELRRLVDEQAALRRVATLVARGASQPEVFDAVVTEAAQLLDEEFVSLLRYDRDGGSTIVAIRGYADKIPAGAHMAGDGDSVSARVLRTGRAARVDSYDGVPGADAATARAIRMVAAVAAPIVADGRTWGALVVMGRQGPLPAGTEDRLAQFTDLVAAAIGNAESRAELTASRARIAATADETRRRIQRDVHDGAQQRLVHTIVTLKLAKAALGGSGPAAALVDESLQAAQGATAELRELARGIMPAALSNGGLRAGIETFVGHVDLPVQIDLPAERLPPCLEITAYFVVAEALTNAVKHARAGSARVTAALDRGTLRLEVRDDGIGGADRTRGSGLVGLADRVAAAGGTITVTSPPDEGTTIAVELPIVPDASADGPEAGGERLAEAGRR